MVILRDRFKKLTLYALLLDMKLESFSGVFKVIKDKFLD